MANKATVRYSIRSIAKSFPRGSIEFVYLHGTWQAERGRNPTMLFGNHTDPKEAYEAARELAGAYIESVRQIPFSRYHKWERWVKAIMARVPTAELH